MNRFWLTLFCTTVSAFAQSPTEKVSWFEQSRAWLTLHHTVYSPQITSKVLREVSVGDFIFSGELDIATKRSWAVTLNISAQSLFGGIKNRRAKIYAVNYVVDLDWKYYLDNAGTALYVSSFHQSTHLADPLPINNLEEIADWQKVRVEIEDINILRLGLVAENENNAWQILLQPVRLNYFLFAEPREMFHKNSYAKYQKRLYLSGLATIWKNEQTRISVNLEGEMESGVCYVLEGVFSLHPGNRPSDDRAQFFLSYEGVSKTNQVRATPYNGVTVSRLSIGSRFLF